MQNSKAVEWIDSQQTAMLSLLEELAQRKHVMSRIQCICNKNFITGTLAKLSVMGEY